MAGYKTITHMGCYLLFIHICSKNTHAVFYDDFSRRGGSVL